MAKLKLNKALFEIDGKPVSVDNKQVFLKDILRWSVLNKNEGSGEDKYKAGKLARKTELKDPDFSIEELALFKKNVGDMFPPLYVEFVWDELEGAKEDELNSKK